MTTEITLTIGNLIIGIILIIIIAVCIAWSIKADLRFDKWSMIEFALFFSRVKEKEYIHDDSFDVDEKIFNKWFNEEFLEDDSA